MTLDPQEDGILRFPSEIVDIRRPMAEKAERFFAAHRAEENALRRLFTLKLAYVPKEGEVVRRRARRADCTNEEWVLAEAMAQGDWRLLITGEEGGTPIAEVAHEALLRNWPRVVRWLDASREFLVWKGQFEADRRTWEEADESERPARASHGPETRYCAPLAR